MQIPYFVKQRYVVHSRRMRGHDGFSLLELLIAMAVMAILATLVYPNFSGYLLKYQRLAATQTLYSLQLQQEEWRIAHPSYAATVDELDSSLANHAHYNFAVSTASASHYELSATAKANSKQTQDKQGSQSCQSLMLTRSNQKTPLECWE